jgi:hypothetical protein
MRPRDQVPGIMSSPGVVISATMMNGNVGPDRRGDRARRFTAG